MSSAVQGLRERLEPDVAALTAAVAERWTVAADPFGDPLLLPLADDGDPLPIGELPWSEVIDAFRRAHGRLPQPGARAIAQQRLSTTRRGGIHG